MIWATVSSWSCFCSLYRVGYKKYNQSYFGNDHLVISIYSLFLCCWNRLFATTSVFSWQNSISLCPASFCTPRPNLPITPGVSWLPTFAFQSPKMKRTSFGVLVLEGLVGLHQFSSVAQLCPTLCNPMNSSTPGLLVHHQLPEFTQTHVHRVSDVIQPFHPLSSPPPPAPNPSQHHHCVILGKLFNLWRS